MSKHTFEYMVWDAINGEYLEGDFLTRDDCVYAIARGLRDLQSSPEESEHLDNQAVMDDFNEGQYQIELRVAGEVSPNA